MALTFSKPAFFVIGPYRTGTTWLYTQLSNVSGVSMPPYKEINFFFDADMNTQFAVHAKSGVLRSDLPDLKMSREAIETTMANMRKWHSKRFAIIKGSAGFLWAQYYYHLPRNFNTLSLYLYTRLFNTKNNTISGDVSPAYFTLSPQAIQVMRFRFPDAKVIIILREPVEREWSNIRTHYLDNSNKHDFDLERYLQRPNLQRDYQTCINTWEKNWGHENICYFFYDDLKANKQQFMQQLLQFIKPGLVVTDWVEEKIGASPHTANYSPETITSEIKHALTEINLPQYKFLAQKFGPDSHAANWLKNALV